MSFAEVEVLLFFIFVPIGSVSVHLPETFDILPSTRLVRELLYFFLTTLEETYIPATPPAPLTE